MKYDPRTYHREIVVINDNPGVGTAVVMIHDPGVLQHPGSVEPCVITRGEHDPGWVL